MLAIPSIAICAGTTFTVLKLVGFYQQVPLTALLLFDGTCIVYFLVGLFLYNNCEDAEGELKPGFLIKGKVFFLMICLVQWNFISYMIPSRDFWAYSLFFVLLSFVFLDHRFVAYTVAGITVSTVVSWCIIPDRLLPVRDELFIPEMALRAVLLFLGFGTIWMLSFMIEKRLAGELEKIADFDTLTLLYNRRKLEVFLDNAAAQNRNTGKPFSVIMIDLDNFKSVNDTYGHSCGDAVLKDIANIIRNTVGNDGVVFRYGGEEILVLFYGDEEESVRTAEKIRSKVETQKTIFEGISVSITVTLGIATYSKKDSNESLVKRSDGNLYYGKTHGKNCVIN